MSELEELLARNHFRHRCSICKATEAERDALIAELRKLREAHLEALEREAQTKAERDYFETEWASCARRT